MSADTPYPQASQSEDDAAVRALYTQLMDGWNKGSAKAFSAPFTEDGHLVAFDGSHFIYSNIWYCCSSNSELRTFIRY